MAAAKRVTLKTIADVTGLAIATVSRALKGDLAIKEETRLRVQQAAIDVGYVPNNVGMRLRAGRSFTLAAVLPIQPDLAGYCASLTNAIATELHGTPFDLNICLYHPDDNALERLADIVDSHSADGIFLNGIKQEDHRVRYLLDKEFPFVTHGRSKWSERHDYFAYDNYAFGEKAVNCLVDRKRTNIQIVSPPLDQRCGADMLAGAQSAARARTIQFSVMPGVDGSCRTDEIATAVNTALSGENCADALILASNNALFGTLRAIEERGLRIGQDLDVYFKDTHGLVQWIPRKVMVEREDLEAAGVELAKMLLARIETPDLPLMHVVKALG